MSGADALPGFRRVQRDFAAHLRDPAVNPPPPGIEDRRLAIYRELFFNNVDNFLRGFFPVLHSLYGESDWLAMSRAFFSRHRAESPYFLQIAEEFLAYLEQEHVARPCDPPYLRELAHYEWLELALDVAEEEFPATGVNPAGDLLAGLPVPSPLAVLAHYHWPVQRISAENTGVQPEETFLMVYRDRADRVRFLELNAVSSRLFALLLAAAADTAGIPSSGRELALRIAGELGRGDDPEAVVSGAAQTLRQWRERDIVLGTLAAGDACRGWRRA